MRSSASTPAAAASLADWPWKSGLINLTERQIADLVAFLEFLTKRLRVERPFIP